MMRCDEWLSSPSKTEEGNSWILGYWTATNEPHLKFVGRQLGPDGIIKQVKKECAPQPRMPLLAVAASLYRKAEKVGQ